MLGVEQDVWIVCDCILSKFKLVERVLLCTAPQITRQKRVLFLAIWLRQKNVILCHCSFSVEEGRPYDYAFSNFEPPHTKLLIWLLKKCCLKKDKCWYEKIKTKNILFSSQPLYSISPFAPLSKLVGSGGWDEVSAPTSTANRYGNARQTLTSPPKYVVLGKHSPKYQLSSSTSYTSAKRWHDNIGSSKFPSKLCSMSRAMTRLQPSHSHSTELRLWCCVRHFHRHVRFFNWSIFL